MRVAVVGAGATGGYLAARLTRAGVPVVLVARGESLRRVRTDGLAITEPDGQTFRARPESVVAAGEELAERADLALFCVKSYDTETAARELAGLVGDDGRVLCLQNGVRNEEILAERLGPDRVLSGVLYIGAQRTAPGEIECGSAPRMLVGRYDNEAGRSTSEVAEVLRGAGLDVTEDPDVRGQKWQKFLFNCGLNPLTAILQRRLGDILARPDGRELYGALVREAIAVGRAYGAPIGVDAEEKVWQQGERMAQLFSSMAEDVRAGRPLEVDTFTGYVCALGRRLGVETPTSAVVLRLLRNLDVGSVAA